MRKKQIIMLIISTLLLITATTAVVFAWLVDIKKTNKIVLESGQVKYLFSGDTVSGLVVPGQNLVQDDNPYQLVNQSTVESQLRIQLTITFAGVEVDYDGVGDDRVSVSFGLGTGFVKESDGFYYYGGLTGYLATTDTDPIIIVDEIILDGVTVHNNYSGKLFKSLLLFKLNKEV